VESIEVFTRAQTAADERWEVFCRREAGVAPQEYQPEIRIEVYGEGLDSHGPNDIVVRPILEGARPDIDAELRLPMGTSATQLGETVLQMANATTRARQITGSARTYRRGRRYVLIAEVSTPEFDRVRPPCIVLPDTSADAQLGKALTGVVDAYEKLSVSPSEEVIAAWEAEIFREVGVKDWRALERNAKLVAVTRHPEGWEMQAARRHRGYWSNDQDDDALAATLRVSVPSAVNTATLGRALRERLEGPTPTGR
jgi:hypothetical protein